MVWSEQIGTSIVVPSDRVDGDGRNYMVIGEDVPTEIASAMTAGLIFRNGTAAPVTGLSYWALGITTSGALELIAYYLANPRSEFPSWHRTTLFSLVLPSGGAIASPTINLGQNQESGFASFTDDSVVTCFNTLIGNFLQVVTGLQSNGPVLITNTADVGINQAGAPAFQIGNSTPGLVYMQLDNNEIGSTVVDSLGNETWGNMTLWHPVAGDVQQTNGTALVRKDYVDSIKYLAYVEGADGTTTVNKTVISATVTIPSGLWSGRRIRVRGVSWVATASGVGTNFTIAGGSGPGNGRAISSSSATNSEVVYFDSDLTAGARTYTFALAPTVASQTVTYKQPFLEITIV